MSAVQQTALIDSVRQLGEYTEFTVTAPQIAAGFEPGHFVAVAVGGEGTPTVLRRAFALYDASPSSGGDDAIAFVVAEHGPGTRWLVQRQAGESLDLVGPLGTPFPMPSGSGAAVLVGGGYGSAPLIPLARRLMEIGSPVEFVLGAATSSRLFGELAAKRTGGSVTVTTDDGSAGETGLVTDKLPEVIKRSDARTVYACGPMPMLRAVADLARRCGITAHVAVEEAMACGIGVCMTCVLPVRGADGESRFVRSCVDGPVFDAQRVRWDDVGALPHDLLGADAMGAH